MKKIMSAVLAVAMMFSLVVIPAGAYTHDPATDSHVAYEGCSHAYDAYGVCSKCGKINMTKFWNTNDKGNAFTATENEFYHDGNNAIWFGTDADWGGHKPGKAWSRGFVLEFDYQVVEESADHSSPTDLRWGAGFAFGDGYSMGVGFIYTQNSETGDAGKFVLRKNEGKETVFNQETVGNNNATNIVEPIEGTLSRKTWHHYKIVYDAKGGHVEFYVDGNEIFNVTDERLVSTIGNWGICSQHYDQRIKMKNAFIKDYDAHAYENGVCTVCGKIDNDAFWATKSEGTSAEGDVLDVAAGTLTSNDAASYAAGFNLNTYVKLDNASSAKFAFGKDGQFALGYNNGNFTVTKGNETVAAAAGTMENNKWYQWTANYNAATGYLEFAVDGDTKLTVKDADAAKLVDAEGGKISYTAGGHSYLRDLSLSSYVCKHADWTEPTCTEDGHCNVCGATKPALGHDFSCGECKRCHVEDPENPDATHDWIEATCVSPKICAVCGETEGDVNPNAHVYKDATCKAPKTCIYDGHTEGDKIAAHDYDGHGRCKICGDRNNTAGSSQNIKFSDSDTDVGGYKYWNIRANTLVMPSAKTYENYTWIMDINVRAAVGNNNVLAYEIGKDNKGTAGYYFADKKFKITYDGQVLAESEEYDWKVSDTSWVEMGVQVSNDGSVKLFVDGVNVCSANNMNFAGKTNVNLRKGYTDILLDYVVIGTDGYAYNDNRYIPNGSDGAKKYTLYPSDRNDHDGDRVAFLDLFKDVPTIWAQDYSKKELMYNGNTYYQFDGSYGEYYTMSMDMVVKGTQVDESPAKNRTFYFIAGNVDFGKGTGYIYGYDFNTKEFYVQPLAGGERTAQPFDLTTDEKHELTVRLAPAKEMIGDEEFDTVKLSIYVDGVLAFETLNPDLEAKGDNKNLRIMYNFNTSMTLTNMVYGSVDYNAVTIHEADPDHPATCVQGALCSICGEAFGDVDPDNHADPHDAPNCTEDGLCGACGKVSNACVGYHDYDENGVCKRDAKVAGDVNGDGVVNDADIILLKRYICRWDVGIADLSVGEVTGDNIVSDDDVILLKRYISNWNVTPTSSAVTNVGFEPEEPTT